MNPAIIAYLLVIEILVDFAEKVLRYSESTTIIKLLLLLIFALIFIKKEIYKKKEIIIYTIISLIIIVFYFTKNEIQFQFISHIIFELIIYTLIISSISNLSNIDRVNIIKKIIFTVMIIDIFKIGLFISNYFTLNFSILNQISAFIGGEPLIYTANGVIRGLNSGSEILSFIGVILLNNSLFRFRVIIFITMIVSLLITFSKGYYIAIFILTFLVIKNLYIKLGILILSIVIFQNLLDYRGIDSDDIRFYQWRYIFDLSPSELLFGASNSMQSIAIFSDYELSLECENCQIINDIGIFMIISLLTFIFILVKDYTNLNSRSIAISFLPLFILGFFNPIYTNIAMPIYLACSNIIFSLKNNVS